MQDLASRIEDIEGLDLTDKGDDVIGAGLCMLAGSAEHMSSEDELCSDDDDEEEDQEYKCEDSVDENNSDNDAEEEEDEEEEEEEEHKEDQQDKFKRKADASTTGLLFNKKQCPDQS